MHAQTIEPWRHEHVFLGEAHSRNERRTLLVIGLTAAMMIAEIAGGMVLGSMALLADGLHMATHAGAIGLSLVAYRFARRHARSASFTFGTGKVGDLAGFASAVALALFALLVGWESLMRMAAPVPIRFSEAIIVAVMGLAVNLASAALLAGGGGHNHGHDHPAHHAAGDPDHHAHRHDHGHGHDHGPGHAAAEQDHNLRSAYLHVLADALTSVLAIAGLVAGSVYGWVWMDPAVGLVAALVVARWSWGLMRDTSAVLLDTVSDPQLALAMRARLEAGGDRVTDLHLWRVGPGHHAAVVALVADHPLEPSAYKARLANLPGLSHLTIEVSPCREALAAPTR